MGDTSGATYCLELDCTQIVSLEIRVPLYVCSSSSCQLPWFVVIQIAHQTSCVDRQVRTGPPLSNIVLGDGCHLFDVFLFAVQVTVQCWVGGRVGVRVK